jgi:hypothetical protein
LKKKLKAIFLLKYHQNLRVLKETEHRKKGEKKKEKGKERKRKAPIVSSNKKGNSIF